MLVIGEIIFHLLFGYRLSPCSLGWPAIYNVDQASLEFVAIFCLLSAGITGLCPSFSFHRGLYGFLIPHW